MSRLRWITAGESHGPRLTAIVEGIPAGLPLLAEDVDTHLARRQQGYGRGGRMKIETDRVEFVGGVRGGETRGSPIAMSIPNPGHAHWLHRMSPAPMPVLPEPLTRPRPREAPHAGETLGGVFEVVATGVMPGLGSHVQWDRKLDGRLAQALMCIQAMKGVEIGAGFGAARSRGSEVHDAIHYDAQARRFVRPTNRAGGLEASITNRESDVC